MQKRKNASTASFFSVEQPVHKMCIRDRYYSSGSDTLPQLRGLNFNVDNAFVIDATPANDTINYWLRDTALVNTDTLSVEIRHHITDTLGVLRLRTDCLLYTSRCV